MAVTAAAPSSSTCGAASPEQSQGTLHERQFATANRQKGPPVDANEKWQMVDRKHGPASSKETQELTAIAEHPAHPQEQDCKSDEAADAFPNNTRVKRPVESIPGFSTNPPEISVTPIDVTHGSKPSASGESRRQKNNEAAKRSRDARRAKEDGVAVRCALLEAENVQLRLEMTWLKSETARLKYVLYSS